MIRWLHKTCLGLDIISSLNQPSFIYWINRREKRSVEKKRCNTVAISVWKAKKVISMYVLALSYVCAGREQDTVADHSVNRFCRVRGFGRLSKRI